MVLADMGQSGLDGGSYCGIYEGSQLVGVVDWVSPCLLYTSDAADE